MLTKDEATARVAKGAALLDAHIPGWASRLDTGTLKMSTSHRCICGQLKPHPGTWDDLPNGFLRAVCSLERTFESAGFFASDYGDYPLLQDLWIEAIADRVVPRVDTPQPVSVPA